MSTPQPNRIFRPFLAIVVQNQHKYQHFRNDIIHESRAVRNSYLGKALVLAHIVEMLQIAPPFE